MAISQYRGLDFLGTSRITNLPNAIDPQEPATLSQLNSLIEGLAWKDSVRVSTQGNINLASPGSTIDGITMVSGDRVLVRLQTAGAENGIYIWNGAAVIMTRSADASTAPELEQAVAPVEEGTNAGVAYRQTVVNATLGTTTLNWAVFGNTTVAASETVAGVLEIATQSETDTGTDDTRAITPLKLANSVFASRKSATNLGDGSATTYTVTHNFGTKDVMVEVYRNSGSGDTIGVEVTRPTTNTVQLLFDSAPTSNQFRVLVRA